MYCLTICKFLRTNFGTWRKNEHVAFHFGAYLRSFCSFFKLVSSWYWSNFYFCKNVINPIQILTFCSWAKLLLELSHNLMFWESATGYDDYLLLNLYFVGEVTLRIISHRTYQHEWSVGCSLMFWESKLSLEILEKFWKFIIVRLESRTENYPLLE